MRLECLIQDSCSDIFNLKICFSFLNSFGFEPPQLATQMVLSQTFWKRSAKNFWGETSYSEVLKIEFFTETGERFARQISKLRDIHESSSLNLQIREHCSLS